MRFKCFQIHINRFISLKLYYEDQIRFNIRVLVLMSGIPLFSGPSATNYASARYATNTQTQATWIRYKRLERSNPPIVFSLKRKVLMWQYDSHITKELRQFVRSCYKGQSHEVGFHIEPKDRPIVPDIRLQLRWLHSQILSTIINHIVTLLFLFLIASFLRLP